MLVGYVPNARVLVTADLVGDTFPLIPPFASRVQKLILENALPVEMIALTKLGIRHGVSVGVSARTSDTAKIQALEQRLIDGIKSKDVKQIMSCYSDNVFAYDVVPPRHGCL
jgi:hypothetical protein